MTKPISTEIRAGDLKPAITGLGKLINTRSKLPALQYVKVEAKDRDTLRLTATDLSLTLSVEVPAKGHRKGGSFLVAMDRLRDLARHTRADEVLTIDPRAGGPNLDEFPEAPAFRGSSIEFPDSAAKGLLRAFTCASHDATRHILQGAYLDTSGKGNKAHRIVGTDGRHLFSSNSLHLPEVKAPVILPAHKLWQWKPIADSRPWTLRLATGKDGSTAFRIEGPSWSVTGNTIDGNYPNYRQVVPRPEEFKTRVTVSDAALEAIARLIPRLPGRKLANVPVGIHLEKGCLSLLARETNDEPWTLHPIDKVEGKGPDLCTFVNRDYLQKAASFGLGDIALIDAMSPAQFSRKGDLMIVMPIRATDPERIARSVGKPAVAGIPVNRGQATPEPSGSPKPLQKAPPVAKPSKKKVAKPRNAKPAPHSTEADPIAEVESRIAEASDALASAGKTLASATGSLKSARQQRGDDREALRGFRSLFSSIKKIATGSN
ncbi:MAG: hypothetical protein KDN20_17545 [Verrucomicrobiae bacterium]|nr:hypothetical protein [Verrucomicrobiae bacterium]